MKTLSTLLLILVATASGSFANGTPYRVETFPARNGGHLVVQTSGGSITVTGTTKNEARVEMHVSRNGRTLTPSDTDLKNFTITIRQDGNTVTAVAERRSGSGNIWSGYNNESISFTVYVPASTSTKLSTSGGRVRLSDVAGTHNVKTSGGSLDFVNITGTVDGRTSGGSINAEGIRGSVDVATSGGSITMKDVDGDMELKTSGGSIRIQNSSGSVVGHTSGGSINASLNQVTGSVDLSTSGGSVTVSLPKNLGYDLDARGNRVVAETGSFSGRSDRDRMTGSVNGGGVSVRLRTSAGTIRIQDL